MLYVVHNQVVFLFGIHNADTLLPVAQVTGIAHLPAAFGIEGGTVQHQLKAVFVLFLHLAVAQNLRLAAQLLIAPELGGLAGRAYRYPIAGFGGGRLLGALLLLFHLYGKPGFVYGKAALPGNQGGKVQREAEGIIELKGHRTANGGGTTGYEVVEAAQAYLQRTQKGSFFFLNHPHDKVLLLR
ncbi:hypothetical protein ADICEAN_03281 [Cesiribacter andamanensis AMV16]|uniref:Uncharacterized protein n=1 Tax=Cesiribacter andamanensis AMV16 TaxID=1279009 RepID=M7N2X4_9BACT|nr:hypothetical protein ADICEAN_03281 [Cesiribacter andamanensis AMV16]